MRWLRFTVLVVVVAVLQAGFLDRIALTQLNIKPDLFLVLLVFFALYGLPKSKAAPAGGYRFDISPAIITSFVIGFAADIAVIGSAMGTRMLSFGIVGSLLAYLHRLIAARKMLYQAFVIFVAGLAAGLLHGFLTSLKGAAVLNFRLIACTALYSAILGPFLFLPCAWWMRIRTHQFRR